jgi:hypothetical protein
VTHPSRAAFRVIPLANPLFHERVWGVPGGASVLRAAGFAEAMLPGSKALTLRLPPDAPLAPVAAAKQLVDDLLREHASSAASSASASDSAADSAAAATPSSPYGMGGSRLSSSSTPEPPQMTVEERASLHRQAADSVLSIDGLLEDAHTRSWDTALNASGAVSESSLSSREGARLAFNTHAR